MAATAESPRTTRARELREEDEAEAKALLHSVDNDHWGAALKAANLLSVHLLLKAERRALMAASPSEAAANRVLAVIADKDHEKLLPPDDNDALAELLTIADTFRGAHALSTARRAKRTLEGSLIAASGAGGTVTSTAGSSGGAAPTHKNNREEKRERALSGLREVWKIHFPNGGAFDGTDPSEDAIHAVYENLKKEPPSLPSWKEAAARDDEESSDDDDASSDGGSARTIPAPEESLAVFNMVTTTLGIGGSFPVTASTKCNAAHDLDVTVGGKAVKVMSLPGPLTQLRSDVSETRARHKLMGLATKIFVRAVYRHLRQTIRRHHYTPTTAVVALLDQAGGLDNLATLAASTATQELESRRKKKADADHKKGGKKAKNGTKKGQKPDTPSSSSKGKANAKGPASSGKVCAEYAKSKKCKYGDKCHDLHLDGATVVNMASDE